MAPIVILGTGLAGYSTAREFRKQDEGTPLMLVTADDGSFYSKPMLSNALASGRTPESLVQSRAGEMAARLKAEIRTHTRVTAVMRDARVLVTEKGEVPYDRLVLALGADPIRVPLEGDGADQVLSVNDLADYAGFRERLENARRVLIMGAGLIGCEFANDLAAGGFQVEAVDPGDWPLGRLLPGAAGRALARGLAGLGVVWRFGRTVQRVDRVDGGLRLTLSDGTATDAQVVLSAVGLRPRTALAEAAGLKVGRGIVVDRYLATSDPHVFALGDCAEVEGLVLPFVIPIMHAARALARTLAGAPTRVVYPAMPVVVKTPAHPVVVAPPPAVAGEWRVEETGEGVRALFLDASGALRGFALTGAAAAEKNALTERLPPLLD